MNNKSKDGPMIPDERVDAAAGNSVDADVPWPVLVRIDGPVDSGRSASVALMNRKAYRKSLESGIAWIYHPLTARVLPWDGDPEFLSLCEGPGCFEMSLPKGSVPTPYGVEAPPDINPDDRAQMNSNRTVSSGVSAGGFQSDVLSELCEIIAERHRLMPAGSYTTHLFEKGLDKIRKKTGEELIELVLARDTQDIIFESADLIYHLLVLLEAADVRWNDVLAELSRRHS